MQVVSALWPSHKSRGATARKTDNVYIRYHTVHTARRSFACVKGQMGNANELTSYFVCLSV